MPKYFPFKVAGYYLYYTMECVIECMHVHASDARLTEGGSAKLFVKPDGDTIIQHKGKVSDADMLVDKSSTLGWAGKREEASGMDDTKIQLN